MTNKGHFNLNNAFVGALIAAAAAIATLAALPKIIENFHKKEVNTPKEKLIPVEKAPKKKKGAKKRPPKTSLKKHL